MVTVTTHDNCPQEESEVVDLGLEESNVLAAPLHEVQKVSCFARSADGQVLGGAIGRFWGNCCELQQLWVTPKERRSGIGTQLTKAFEALAAKHGCSTVYLETFSFQAPSLYIALGYTVEYERKGYPHSISKYHMLKHLKAHGTAA